jgi:catechol 1,2-dioxygenase/hydroxyquinol 1,2-dioxygenase
MRELTRDTITDYIADSFAVPAQGRNAELMTGLVRCLHDYIRDVNLTHGEWADLLQFFYNVGDKTSPVRDEFMLLSDVMGITSLVDLVAAAKRPAITPASPLGPFYLANAPLVEQGGWVCRQDEPGTPTVFKGQITDELGAVIENALVDIWHNADSGMYSNEDESQHDMNNRGRIFTDQQGRFEVQTIRPQPYSVPMDGPVGAMMQAFERSPWRSAHLHVIVSAEGFDSVVTELFFADCEYIDIDAVGGVRPSLTHKPVYETTARGKTLIVDHGFCLQASV